MKKLLFTMLAILSLCVELTAQTVVTVPLANTNTGSVNDPFGAYFGYERTALIYTPSELGGNTGNIQSLSFYVNSLSSAATASNVSIYLKERTTTFSTASTYTTETTGATLVYGPIDIPASAFVAGGWFTVYLASPFSYTGGTNNLEVIIETNATGGGSGETSTSKQFRYATATNNQYYQSWNADTSPPTTTGTRSSSRPNIQVAFGPLVTCFPPTTLVSSPSTYSATFSWNASVSAPSGGYEWEVRTSGAVGSGTTGLSGSGSTLAGIVTASLSGLTASTTHSLFVRSNCGASDFSPWATVTFTTLNAPCLVPTSQPTSIVFGGVTNSAISGTFTAATPTVSNYLVIRTLGTAPNTPTNGTVYTTGSSTALGGTVVSVGSGTTFTSSSSIVGNTNYAYYIYSFNNTGCTGGPLYNTAAPLTTTVTTCPAKATALTTTLVTTNSFGLTWTAPVGGTAAPITYSVEVSTNSAFTAPISGSPFVVAAPTNSLSFTGLNPATIYYYRVVADNGCNTGPTTSGNVTMASIPEDLQVSSLVAPSVNSTACYASSLPVIVQIKNSGTSVLDFSINNATLITDIAGVNPQTFTTVISTGTLAANATQNVTVTSTYNMSTAGIYTINANATLATPDVNTSNDAIATITRTTAAATTAAQMVNFTGYTGSPASLNTAFAGWTEGTGALNVTIGGDGQFTSSSSTQNALYSEGAKMNLYNTNNGWIISPKFIPTSNTAVTYKATLASYNGTTAVNFGLTDTLKAMVSTNCGVNWIPLRVFNSTTDQGVNSSSNALKSYSENLSAYAGQPILFAIQAKRGVSSTSPDIDIFVDDINIASCFPTSSITVSNTLQTTADLSWTTPVNGVPSNYIYEVRTSGAAGSGTIGLVTTGTVVAPTTSVALTGLTSLTSYSVYLQSDCGAGDMSTWSTVKTFTTLANCGIVTAVTTTNVTGYNATISWTEPSTGTPSAYIYEIRTTGAAGSGTLGLVTTNSVVGTSTMVTVTTLTPTTSYSVYVQTDCGGGLLSAWTPEKTFTTTVSCPAPTSLTINDIMPTAATASWTAGATETSWYVQHATPTTTAAASTPSYSLSGLSASTNYTVSVKAVCATTNDSSVWVTKTFATLCQPADITGVGSTRCGVGTTTLMATSTSTSAVINWYSNATGGSSIATGTVFTTPTITSNATYYATSTDGLSSVNVGPANNITSLSYVALNNWGQTFNSSATALIQSVAVYPGSAGTVTLSVQSTVGTGATIFGTVAATFAAGDVGQKTVIPLGITVPAGTGYKILLTGFSSGFVGFHRESTPAPGFPFSAAGSPVTITSSEWGGTTTGTLYYFYDWSIGTGCESARVPVTATVTAPPALALTTGTTVCSDVIAPLTVTSTLSDYDSYVWSPATNLYTDAAATTAYTGGTATTVYYKSTLADTKLYTVNATSSVSGCGNTATTTMMTNVPVVLASITPTAICSASTVTLNATTNAIITGTTSVGSGSSTSAASPTSPFNGAYGGMKAQYLITAADLMAGGVNAGNITSLALGVTVAGSPLQDFAISMGTTTLNAFGTNTDLQSGLSSVYSTTLFTPVVGNNVFTFSTPFNWDGTSNIIISTCWSNGNTSNTTSTVKSIATSYRSAQSWLKDSETSSVICGLTGTITSGAGSTALARPQFIFGGQVNGQSAGNLNWSWNPGSISSNTAVVNPVNTGTLATTMVYTVTGTNPLTTCSNTSIVSVLVNPVPATVVANNSTQCGYGIPTASIVGMGGTYNWYNATTSGMLVQSGTSATYTTAINNTTTFYVAENNGNCEGPLTPVTVTVTTADAITTSISSTTICPAQTVTLTAINTGTNQVYSYTWLSATNNGITASVNNATATASPSLAGVYEYTVVGNDGACNAIATTSLTVIAPPDVFTTATPSVVCSGSSISLEATTGAIGSGTVAIGTNTTLTGATSQPTAFCNRWLEYRMQTVYTAAELSAAGLVAGNITSIAYNITTLGSDATNDNYTVKMGTTSVSAFTDFVSSTSFTTVYPAATYTHAVGVNVINFTTPFNWDGTSNLIVEVSHDGADLSNNSQTYYTATSGNMLVYSIDGDIIGTPSVNRLNVVFGGQAVIKNAGTLTWQWNPGSVMSNTMVVNPTNTGTSPIMPTYTVTAIDPATTCSNTAVVTVTVNPIPNVAATTANSVVCLGSSATLVGGGATTYTWLPQGGQFATTVITPTATTVYTVTGTSLGCSNTATVELVSAAVPSVSATATPTNAQCAGTAITLNATGATTYTWLPTGGNAATTSVSPIANTVYTVTGSNGSCSAKSTVTVNVIANPTVTATSSKTLICTSESAVLTASSSATSYTWSSNASSATTTTVTVSPTTTTNYTVTVSNGTCTASAAVSVSVSLCTGIEELASNSISVYPNPTNSIVNIAITNELITNAVVEMYDAVGKLVIRETLTRQTSSVNMNRLEDGVYFYKIISDNQEVKIGKLIKQ